jgi:hypothetical protein
MNKDESIAETFLRSLGLGMVAYEPDGNIPPDFLVDNRIAVEVRRLNENVNFGGQIRGLESEYISLGKVIRAALDGLGAGPPGATKYYVNFGFKHPLGSYKEIKRDVTDFLKQIRSRPAVSLRSDFASGVWIEAFAAPHLAGNQFRPAIAVGEDSGGMILQLLKDNIEHYATEKSQKIAKYRSKYSEWWLVLLDHIDYALDDLDRQQFRADIKIVHTWDRLFLVDPTDPSRSFEV